MENQEMFNEKDDPNSPAENNVPDEDPDDVFEDEEDVDAEIQLVNSSLDNLNSALDHIENCADNIKSQLLELLMSNREILKEIKEQNESCENGSAAEDSKPEPMEP